CSFSDLVLDLLMPYHQHKQRHRALTCGVNWHYYFFASSLFSSDGAIGSVFSRGDYYKSASIFQKVAFAFLVRGFGVLYFS
ncbi:hypothetical protein, partial [Citrobacter freundii]